MICAICKRGSKLLAHPSCQRKGEYAHIFRLKRKVFDKVPEKKKDILRGVYKVSNASDLHKSLNRDLGFQAIKKYDANDIWRK